MDANSERELTQLSIDFNNLMKGKDSTVCVGALINSLYWISEVSDDKFKDAFIQLIDQFSDTLKSKRSHLN